VELFEAIRRDQRGDGLSIRQLAEMHRVHRRTVRQALASAVPPARKQRAFVAPVLDPVKPLIDAMLREDLDAPRKQRHTARRILARLVDEHGVTNVSYSTVRDYVARRLPLDQDLHRSAALRCDRGTLTFAGQIIETVTDSHRLAHARKQQNAQKVASSPAR
jgi:DNA-binding transcriptional regulator YhcF (GntR family)